MGMEKFIKQVVPDHPSLTVRKNGTISLNRKATEQFDFKDKKSATLHFDAEESVIGIKPVSDEKEPSAFRIVKEKGRTFTISCSSFLRHCGIPFKGGSKIFEATWDGKAKMILVKLQQNRSKEVKT